MWSNWWVVLHSFCFMKAEFALSSRSFFAPLYFLRKKITISHTDVYLIKEFSIFFSDSLNFPWKNFRLIKKLSMQVPRWKKKDLSLVEGISSNACISSSILTEKLIYSNTLFIFFIFSDGNWGEWRNVLQCSKTCGAGRQIKSRLCNNPVPQNGGQQCLLKDGSGRARDEMKVEDCNTQPCPGK